MPSPFSFQILHEESHCAARRSTFQTPHGVVEMPAFMPVGTQATVKGLAVDQIRRTGARIVLANTYLLALRPGAETVQRLGGLHRFMGWQGPILTDSGGFQIFSLADQVRISEEGAAFRSHIDGSPIELTPERAIEIQERLGADVAMVLDDVVPLPSPREKVRQAMERTVRWAQRCQAAARRTDQALFAIVQGGLEPDLRVDCAERLAAMGFVGYGVGGLSVGETADQMAETLEVTVPALPADRPRYLMGVGRPEDLLSSIGRGIDLFDCVMPTRNGRNALAFTDEGPLRLRNQQYALDERPLESDCSCPACRHSRGYLRHLFQAHEMLGPILLSAHNLTYYQRLLADARGAIEEDRFMEFQQAKLAGWSDRGGQV